MLQISDCLVSLFKSILEIFASSPFCIQLFFQGGHSRVVFLIAVFLAVSFEHQFQIIFLFMCELFLQSCDFVVFHAQQGIHVLRLLAQSFIIVFPLCYLFAHLLGLFLQHLRFDLNSKNISNLAGHLLLV